MGDFFLSQCAIASSREPEHRAKYKAKINALNEIIIYGWKHIKRLKKYFDDYYKNTFYLSSNFCKLYRKAGFNINALMEQLKSSKCKTKGFLAMIKKANLKHTDISKGNCGALTRNYKQLCCKISKENNDTTRTITADRRRVANEMCPELLGSILRELENFSKKNDGKPPYYPYIQGEANIFSILRVTGVDDLEDGWGDRYLHGMQAIYSDNNYETPTNINIKLQEILKKDLNSYKLEIENHVEVHDESSKEYLKQYEGTKDNSLKAMFISQIYQSNCTEWFRKPHMFDRGVACFMKLNKNGDIKNYWLSLYEESIELLTPSRKDYLMKELLKAPDKKITNKNLKTSSTRRTVPKTGETS